MLDFDQDGLPDDVDPDDDNDEIPDDGGPAPCSDSTELCDDNCPFHANPFQEDEDGDGVGDVCDRCPGADDRLLVNTDDLDSDGINDACDLCLDDDVNDPDGDWICAQGFNPVTGTIEAEDNCARTYNPSQFDSDDDGVGDACDNCRAKKNPTQDDGDGDEIGDLCDTCTSSMLNPDLDEDNVCDAVDLCPGVRNPEQLDTDLDGIGDACDPDRDNDGALDDGDGSGTLGDAPCPPGVLIDCDDMCPLDPAVQSGPDADGDGVADSCDGDRDDDGVPNFADNCPDTHNPEQIDTDRDRGGDECDPDDDNDGVNDIDDRAIDGSDASKDPFQCADTEAPSGDGCDDCTAGLGVRPNNDGSDLDGDGLCDAGDPDADGDGVCGGLFAIGCVAGVLDSDDLSKYTCADTESPLGDGCDDCRSGSFDPFDDGLDSDGDGICNAGEDPASCAVPAPCDAATDPDCDGIATDCDNCPLVPNGDCLAGAARCDVDGDGGAAPDEVDRGFQRDSDSDGLGDACDFCIYSDDNDRDGDNLCLIGAARVDIVGQGSAGPPAGTLAEFAAPDIGRTGFVPYVAYSTLDHHVAVLAIEEGPVRSFFTASLDVVNPGVTFGTLDASFAVSEDQLVLAPDASPTDESDYRRFPFGGLRVVPFDVSASGVVADSLRATYFDCYGGTYGPPGLATLDGWYLAEPTPWIVAQVSCPSRTAFEGPSNRRVLLGGGIDPGPSRLFPSVGPRDGFGSLLLGDDRIGQATGDAAEIALSVHDPLAPGGIDSAGGFESWAGNLSPSGDAAAARNASAPAAQGWQIRHRARATSKVRDQFRRLSFLEGPSEAAADNRLVLWSELDRVRGAHPPSGTRVGFLVAGETFAARHQVIARWRPGELELWRWFYEDTCPDDDAPEVDKDGDGIGDACDLCPTLSTRSQSDIDRDGIGDDCDLCPYIPGSGPDRDSDGVGDACDPIIDGGDFECPLLEMQEQGTETQLTCSEGDHREPVVGHDPGSGDSDPDYSDTTIGSSGDEDTPGRSVDCGNVGVAPEATIYLYVAAVDADGQRACDPSALPICATREGRLDFERPLFWIDNCLDATDGDGVVFNHPDGGATCTRGTVTRSGTIECTMVRVNPFDESLGCLYKLSAPPGTCSLAGRTMHPELRPEHLVNDSSMAICATGDVDFENSVTVTDSLNAGVGHVAAGGEMFLRNSVLVNGDVIVGADLRLINSADITGDAFVGGNVSLGNSSTIGGAITAQPWPGDICTCGRDLDADMATFAMWNDNARLFADPNIAQWMQGTDLIITNSGSITLRGGDYFLTGLRFRNSAELQVLPGHHVRLWISGFIDMDNSTDMNCPVNAGSRVSLTTNSTIPVTFNNSSDSVVKIYAPNALVNFRNSAELHGGITGASLLVENSGFLVRDVDVGGIGGVSLSCQWGEP